MSIGKNTRKPVAAASTTPSTTDSATSGPVIIGKPCSAPRLGPLGLMSRALFAMPKTVDALHLLVAQPSSIFVQEELRPHFNGDHLIINLVATNKGLGLCPILTINEYRTQV